MAIKATHTVRGVTLDRASWAALIGLTPQSFKVAYLRSGKSAEEFIEERLPRARSGKFTQATVRGVTLSRAEWAAIVGRSAASVWEYVSASDQPYETVVDAMLPRALHHGELKVRTCTHRGITATKQQWAQFLGLSENAFGERVRRVERDGIAGETAMRLAIDDALTSLSERRRAKSQELDSPCDPIAEANADLESPSTQNA